jgi:glycosyltransferase involved in cell wall biosynthesis
MLRRKLTQLHHERDRIKHNLMVHSPDEEITRRLLRVRGSYISQNIYIDKDIFVPLSSPKLYQAIYIAQLKPFKRHYLASDVTQSLMVASDLSNLHKYEHIVPHASFNDHPLSKAEVAESINSASCSLALSRIEGAMLASFESLLCGVPVVSTPSKGGRDVFLNAANSLIVEPTPNSVAAAVKHFHLTPPDPNSIRAKALEDLESHKIRFCNYVSDLAVTLGGSSISPDKRYERYFSTPGGLSNLFIWADKFERQSDVERIWATSFVG